MARSAHPGPALSPPRPSRPFGAIGFALALIGGLVVGAGVAAMFIVAVVRPTGVNPNTEGDWMLSALGVVFIAGMTFQLAGFMAGVLGLFQPDRPKLPAVGALGCGGLPLLVLIGGMLMVGLTGGV